LGEKQDVLNISNKSLHLHHQIPLVLSFSLNLYAIYLIQNSLKIFLQSQNIFK
jgi:hypothetical protein